jgi:hypothetical protein
MAVELAGVVGAVGRSLVRHLLGRDEVRAPHLVGGAAELPRDVVDEALDHVGRLRAPGAAVGVDRHRVRVVAADAHVRGRDVVDPRRHAGAQHRDVGAVLRQIGPEVGLEVDPHGEEFSMRIEGHLGGHEVVAPLRVADEVLAPVCDPFHRALEPLGREGAEWVLPVDEGLGAEAAADIGRDDAQPLLLDLEAARDGVLEGVAALGAEGDRPAPAAAVVLGDAVAGLEVVRHEAVVDEPERNDPVGRREGFLGLLPIADRRVEGDVVRDVRPYRPDARRFRALDPDHGIEGLPFDLDRLRGVAGLKKRLGHHEDDSVADVAHGVGADERIRRRLHRRAVGVLDRCEARHVPEMRHVGVRQDQEHPGHGAGRRKVAEAEPRMGVGAAQHGGMHRPLRPVVVRVTPLPAHEPHVLDPPHRLADTEPLWDRHGNC